MLRDFPPLGPRTSNDDALFMNTTLPTNDRTPDPLDDVFGSAPSSPTLHAHRDEYGVESGAQRAEHSDVPRLRSIHVTNGYREGLSTSKDQYIQAGFDEGYSLGGEIGAKAGRLLGTLEGIAQAVSRLGNTELSEEVRKVFDEAREELKSEKILSPEYFGPDGIWLYDVPGQENEGEVTFGDVAGAHPVLRKWKARVEEIVGRFGVELK